MKLNAVIASALLLGSAAAQAAPTTWTGTGLNMGQQVSVFGRGTVNTAEILGTNTSPAGSFAAFCAEINASYASPLIGQSVALTGAQADALSKLFTGSGWKSWSSVTDSVTTAFQVKALQVGVWEIVSGDEEFDVQDGSFDITGDADVNSVTLTLAGWMGSGNTSMAGSIYRISDNSQLSLGQQDLIIAVPEPSTYALMFAGLAAVGFVARRRKNAK